MSIRICFLVVLMLMILPGRSDLVLASAPVLNQAESEKYFKPLAKKIESILGEKVIYQYPKDWITYGRKMQAGEYDILVDQPHFAAWRMSITSRLDHLTIGQFPGSKRYAVATIQDRNIYALEDLIGKHICAKPSPEISTMVVFSQFKNPVQQPVLVELRGNDTWNEGRQNLLNGKCKGWIVDYDEYSKVDYEKRQQFNVEYISDYIPNMVVTVSRKVKRKEAEKLKAEFLAGKLNKELKPLMAIFSPNEEAKLLPMSKKDLLQADNLLHGVLWGW